GWRHAWGGDDAWGDGGRWRCSLWRRGGIWWRGADELGWGDDWGGSRPWEPFVPIRRDGGDYYASKPQDCHNELPFIRPRGHNHCASINGGVSMYTCIKAQETHRHGVGKT